MHKKALYLSFMPQKCSKHWFFCQKMGFSRATCPPSTAISMAIIIIPNLGGMFNKNRTFLGKNLLDAGCSMLNSGCSTLNTRCTSENGVFLGTKRQKMHKKQQKKNKKRGHFFLDI